MHQSVLFLCLCYFGLIVIKNSIVDTISAMEFCLICPQKPYFCPLTTNFGSFDGGFFDSAFGGGEGAS